VVLKHKSFLIAWLLLFFTVPLAAWQVIDFSAFPKTDGIDIRWEIRSGADIQTIVLQKSTDDYTWRDLQSFAYTGDGTDVLYLDGTGAVYRFTGRKEDPTRPGFYTYTPPPGVWVRLEERPDAVFCTHCDAGSIISGVSAYLPIGFQLATARLGGAVYSRLRNDGFNVRKSTYANLPGYGNLYMDQVSAVYHVCGAMPAISTRRNCRKSFLIAETARLKRIWPSTVTFIPANWNTSPLFCFPCVIIHLMP